MVSRRCRYAASKRFSYHSGGFCVLGFDKAKPPVRMGRKATGLLIFHVEAHYLNIEVGNDLDSQIQEIPSNQTKTNKFRNGR